MDGFEKSAKTTRSPPQVPFQTRTRAQSTAEVTAAAAAEVATAEAVGVNTTDTDIITATENLSQHQTGTLNPTISDSILVDLSSPSDSHSTTGARSITDAHVMTGNSSAVADVSQTIGVLQHTLLRETLLEHNEARTEMDIYRQRLDKLETDREAEHQRRQQLEARLQHHITEEKHLAALLRVRDDEVIERQRTIDEVRAERLSLQGQLAQFRQKLNQMSATQHSNSQTTAATNVVYTSNRNTQPIRLGDNSFGNTGSVVVNSVTPVNLGLGYNLKPDIYDGTTPLSEYLNQLNLIAKSNSWNDEKKMIALAASLRNKAKSVLSSFKDTETLDLKTLLDKLEARFGEQSGSSSYSLFQNRRQKPGEDLPTLAADVEKVAVLVYPECSLEVQDKIVCSQFIIGIYNIGVRETLQLERITSLQIALARALEVKVIKEQNRNSISQQNINGSQNTQKFSGKTLMVKTFRNRISHSLIKNG